MRFPVVVTDFDDTLLRSDLTLSPYTMDVIRRYEEKGGTLIISTGRMYQSIYNSALRVGLKKGLVISYQGALINNMENGKVLFQQTIEYSQAAIMVQMLEKEKECSVQIYINDRIYVKEITPRSKEYGKVCEVKIEETGNSLYDYINELKMPVQKILAIVKPERADQLCREYPKMFDKADFCLSKPYFFECIPKGVSKGKAVEYICNLKGITAKDVIVFGDGNNDISMLDFADLSFAVENAQQGAKKAAKMICPSNDEDGVAKTIEKYCL